MQLNDPFVFEDGSRVRSTDDWRRRRKEIQDLVVGIEYGGLPPEPAPVRAEPLHTHKPKRFPGATYTQYRIVLEDSPGFHFRLDVMMPPHEEPVPCVLTGDGCWRYANDEITLDLMTRGIALAEFSRTAVVPDVYSSDRSTGLYPVYPDAQFGAIAAWAWGYHRCVDVLLALEGIDSRAVAAVGHSRGGKAALLAGATDERIAVTAPNDSGCGGAGSYKWQGPQSETMTDTHRAIPYWFGSKLWEYLGREAELPFDQHFLKALVAPRSLLSTEALGDLWANPEGTYQTFDAAREVYRFLGAEQRIAIWYREGGHFHGRADWAAFVNFLEWRLRGAHPTHEFEPRPFPEMPRAFDWRAPDGGATTTGSS